MIQHLKIKKLISAYSDRECSPEEVTLVEAHLKQCAKCADELKSLDKVSVQLQAWQDQDLTPDLERRIKEAESEKLDLEQQVGQAFENRKDRDGRRLNRQLERVSGMLEDLYEQWVSNA